MTKFSRFNKLTAIGHNGWCGERETGEGVREAEKIEADERVREDESTTAQQGSERGREAGPERVDC